MSQASQLSPELARGLLTLARSLVAAIRNWSLYPAEHPSVAQALERLCASIRDTTGGAILSIAVTPDTLIIEGAAADRTNTAIAEAAALLHDRDLLELTFLGEIPTESIRALLTLLTLGAQERRDRGGPAKMWADAGHPSIVLKQVDYRQVLARETGGSGDAAPHDDVIDGQASERLATIFKTIASDEDRKRRVLTLTRSMLTETSFGRASQFETLWTSMQELLISYNDALFVSESYRASLDGVGGRAGRMAHAELPPELPTWLETLGEQSVRALSVTLLVDLLNLETDADRAGEIAGDLAALAENLPMSGAYNDALAVTTTLADRGSGAAIGCDVCRRALNELGESPAMRETAALVGDLDEPRWRTLRSVIQIVGRRGTATAPANIPGRSSRPSIPNRWGSTRWCTCEHLTDDEGHGQGEQGGCGD